MSATPKQRRKWILILSALSCLAAVFYGLDGLALKQDQGSSTFGQFKLFTEVMSVVKENYVQNLETEQLIQGAMKGMISQLDPHSSVLTPEEFKEMQIETSGSFAGVGMVITLKDGLLTVVSPIEDSPAQAAGIRSGDAILKIDEAATQGMTTEEAAKRLRGPKGTKVKLLILSDGTQEPREVELVRDVIRVKSVKTSMLAPGYGYARVSQFQENTSEELARQVALLQKQTPLRGLILDLRNNPGGLLDQAVAVSDFFLKKGLIVYTKGRRADQELSFRAKNDGNEPTCPLVVLVNAGSASASEIVAGALQDQRRAVVLGSQTFGKGSVQSVFPLDEGWALRLTTALYYTPKGRSIQATGIAPDITVAEGGETDFKRLKKEPLTFRERDLEGHFENGSENKKEGASRPALNGPVDLLTADPQVERAYQILKALEALKAPAQQKG